MPGPQDVELVGRDAVLARMLRLLGGRPPNNVVLAGETGVGKTRLAETCLATLAAQGRATVSIQASEATTDVPFGALLPLLPALGPRPTLRADLLRRAADDLAAVAGGADGVLLVDDAHLLDEASAAAVHHVAASASSAVLLTVQTEARTVDAIVGLWKDGLAHRLDVGPLGEEATVELATRLLGAPLDSASRTALWRASQGNPLLVVEILVAANAGGGLRSAGGIWRFTTPPPPSPRLRDLVTARLDDITPLERDAMELLSVAGEIGLDLVATLVDPATLEALGRRQLLEVGEDGRRRPVRLAHPLHGECVRPAAGSSASLGIHRRLAEALDSTGARRREDVLRLALWRLEAGDAPHPDLLVAAARQALHSWDEPLAIRLAAAASDAGAGVEADIIRAQALIHQGRFEEVAALLSAALDGPTSDDDRVTVAVQLSGPMLRSLGDAAGAFALLDDAERRLGRQVPLVQAQLATLEAMVRRPLDAIARAEPLLSGPVDRAYVTAAAGVGLALTAVGRAVEALALVDAAVRVVADGLGTDDPFGAHTRAAARVFALGELGRLVEAETLAREIYERARHADGAAAQAWSAMTLGRTALLAGRVDDGSALFSEGAALFDELAEPDLRRWCLAGVVLCRAALADGAGVAAVAGALELSPTGGVRMGDPDNERARAWRLSLAGDHTGARTALLAAIDVASSIGEAGTALVLRHELARLGAAPEATTGTTTRDRAVQGRLAAARVGFIEAANNGGVSALAEAGEAFASLGARLFAAEAFGMAFATTLGQRRGGDDAIGRRARELAAQCQGAQTPALATVAPTLLSPRQREIARLAARGDPSKVIARALGLSVRTVDNHLHVIYRRLGVSGRANLAGRLDDIGR